MKHHHVRNRRIYQWAYAVGAVAIASAVGVFVQPATAVAEWDIGAYDSCLKKADARNKSGQTESLEWYEETVQCCQSSGGEHTGGKCTAPPATAQQWPQGPLGQLPGTGPAAQVPNAPQSPLGQVPGAGQATQTPTTPPPRMGTLNLP
ncbi:hypothetical protein [Mycolicibacterium elephantis]|uniref:hypothetical protein n=1 Tax=Mycolicibacterium elephantis TaxID=81858 RepID=UPI000FE208FB|nr:hypothetical protein [Mycolicibacterium elephantis]MCV7220077.1 hypothetical protein [Mycolicibacterium elephantis]